jgi:hypothetical protein
MFSKTFGGRHALSESPFYDLWNVSYYEMAGNCGHLVVEVEDCFGWCLHTFIVIVD